MKVTLKYRDMAGDIVTEFVTLLTSNTVFALGVPIELPENQDMVYFEDEHGLFCLEKHNIIEMKTDLFPPSLN
jgi:hypothetical protein